MPTSGTVWADNTWGVDTWGDDTWGSVAPTLLTVEKIKLSENGLLESLIVPVADMKFANNGRQFLYVDNHSTGFSSLTITITTQVTVDGLIVNNLVVVVLYTDIHLLGPFPPSTYNDVNGFVQMTFSVNDGVLINLYQIGG